MATTSAPTSKVKSLDHLVLTVASIPDTIKWYQTHLGMQPTTFITFGVERHGLKFGSQKINLHQRGAEFEPKAAHVQAGSGDLCFLTDDKVEDVHKRFKEAGVQIDGDGEVTQRTGAVGKLRSVYVRDPDGNLIEISNLVQ